MAVHQAVAGGVFDGVLFFAVLFPQDALMRSWTELRIFLSTFEGTNLE